MTLSLIGEKAAVIWHCRTFLFQAVRPGTRTPYSWMSREVCKFQERKLCLQTHKQVNQVFPFFISHCDATTCTTKNADSPLVLGVQPGLAVTARVTPVLPFSVLLT